MTPSHDRATIAVSLAALALMSGVLATHAFFVAPSTDDFCNRLIATSRPLPAALLAAYEGWTGRLLTTTLLYATLSVFDLFELRYVGVALVLLFVVAAWQMATLATIDNPGLRVHAGALALAMTMLGLYPLTGQALFWITGGIVYTVPLVLVLAWLISMRRLFVDGHAGRGALAGFALGVLVGNAIELVVPLALVYGGLMLWLKRAELTASARRAAIWHLAGVAAGALLLLLAPGNLVRAGATAGSLGTDPAVVAQGLAQMAMTMLDIGGPVLAAVVVAACAATLAARGSNVAGDRLPATEPWLFALGAIASVGPVLLAPAQFTPRNLYFALVALLVAALLLAVSMLARLRRASLILLAIAVPGAAGSAILYGRHIDEARAIHESLAGQDRRLKDAARAGLRDVVVPPIGIVPPPTVHFIELSPDASRWDNRCVARYYGLEGVAIPGDSR